MSNNTETQQPELGQCGEILCTEDADVVFVDDLGGELPLCEEHNTQVLEGVM